MLFISCYYDHYYHYCLEIFFCWIWSRYWKAAMFRRFPKEVTLCQQAPKDLVTELRKPAYFPKSKWAAWGHHLWKFPLDLIQETLPALSARPAAQRGLISNGEIVCVLGTAAQRPVAAPLPCPSSGQPLWGIHYGWPQTLLFSPNWWLGGSREGHSAFSTLITMISKKLRV